jgi:hypothetical protein
MRGLQGEELGYPEVDKKVFDVFKYCKAFQALPDQVENQGNCTLSCC